MNMKQLLRWETDAVGCASITVLRIPCVDVSVWCVSPLTD
jgi:hypothetical protein